MSIIEIMFGVLICILLLACITFLHSFDFTYFSRLVSGGSISSAVSPRFSSGRAIVSFIVCKTTVVVVATTFGTLFNFSRRSFDKLFGIFDAHFEKI